MYLGVTFVKSKSELPKRIRTHQIVYRDILLLGSWSSETDKCSSVSFKWL